MHSPLLLLFKACFRRSSQTSRKIFSFARAPFLSFPFHFCPSHRVFSFTLCIFFFFFVSFRISFCPLLQFHIKKMEGRSTSRKSKNRNPSPSLFFLFAFPDFFPPAFSLCFLTLFFYVDSHISPSSQAKFFALDLQLDLESAHKAAERMNLSNLQKKDFSITLILFTAKCVALYKLRADLSWVCPLLFLSPFVVSFLFTHLASFFFLSGEEF